MIYLVYCLDLLLLLFLMARILDCTAFSLLLPSGCWGYLPLLSELHCPALFIVGMFVVNGVYKLIYSIYDSYFLKRCCNFPFYCFVFLILALLLFCVL